MRYLITLLVLGVFLPKVSFASFSDEAAIVENDFLPSTRRNLNYDTLPEDAITDEQLKNGAFVLYIVGIIYLFACMYVVHRKYFYPLLECHDEQIVVIFTPSFFLQQS